MSSEEIKENPDKQIPNRIKDAKGRMIFPPGVSGNLKGRPKGKTIKEMVKEWLEKNPDDMKAFIEHFVKNNKELTWQMLEGRPRQQMEVDVDKDTLGELTEFFKIMAKDNDRK